MLPFSLFLSLTLPRSSAITAFAWGANAIFHYPTFLPLLYFFQNLTAPYDSLAYLFWRCDRIILLAWGDSVHALYLEDVPPTKREETMSFSFSSERVQSLLGRLEASDKETALLHELLGGPEVAGAELRSDIDKANALRLRAAFSRLRIDP